MNYPTIYTVSEITRTIKLLIEENIPTLWVEGEVSNFKAHYSGHYYFTLKDQNSQLSAVMWKSRAAALPFKLEDGMLVQALGNIRLYEKSGRYQIDIIRLQPAGAGRLQMEFEELKQKLMAEGLFDASHKKELPPFPHKIGVVTSSTGAAVQDILNILKRRAPHLEIIVRPAKVQGEGAAKDIAEAINEFNQYKDVDLLIVGRGGGSLEDLWAFNEEITARAIFNSDIPIISAVGHEIDFTIADFVSDLRAPTPSAAAELAVPDYVELHSRIANYYDRIFQSITSYIKRCREKINGIQRSYGLRRPEDLLKQYACHLDELSAKLQQNFTNDIRQKQEYLKQLNLRLLNLSPKKVLKRGYSVSYIDGKIITDLKNVKINSMLVTELYKGSISSQVKEIEKGNKHAKEESINI
jgi:exodeoxyribonuclease VII large subunit